MTSASQTDAEMDLTVLGGGIAGITTALAAVAEGFEVQLVTKERADGVDASDADPAFATPVGGGNIEPIGAEDVWLLRLFGASKRFYGTLREETDHVSKRPFYFVDESGGSLEFPYRGHLDGYRVEQLGDGFDDVDEPLPRRNKTPENATVARYRVFGADDSLLGNLYETAENHGVTVRERCVDLKEDVHYLPGNVVVNCTGFRGPLVHGTSVHEEVTPVKGHLLHVEGVPAGTIPGDEGIEYAIDLQDCGGGHDAVPEAYGFVRDVGGDDRTLVLGGSEIEGTFEEAGWGFEWDSPGDHCEDSFDGPGWKFEWSGPVEEIGGRQVPERIVDLNTEVWQRLMDSGDFDPMDYDTTVVSGWRPKRDAGPRLRITECEGTTVADNYGWGSFGWTLAPGAAASLVTELRRAGVSRSGEPLDDASDPVLTAIGAAFDATEIDNG